MRNRISPLRYPGGKACLVPLLRQVIEDNGLSGGTLVEPFCGGAAASLSLLFGEYVDRIIINDRDRAVFSFWSSVLNETEKLVRLVCNAKLTIEEYKSQRSIYHNRRSRSRLEIGFAAFYLNRCNRSGIIAHAGPIGGYDQSGTWGIDARFNREELCNRIQRIASFRNRIEVCNQDGIALLTKLNSRDRVFAFIDPPYVKQGERLYSSDFDDEKHTLLSKHLLKDASYRWLLTYDDHPLIRRLYGRSSMRAFSVQYSAQSKKSGREVMVHSKGINLSPV